jgi:catechol 2,3-dioxygenase-like lactoylglutathione lyase family enzyme
MRIDHGGLLVTDVERSVRFYVDALGLELLARPSTFDTPGAWLQVGEQQIHLIGETEPGRARAMTPRYDEAEIVIDDIATYEDNGKKDSTKVLMANIAEGQAERLYEPPR